MNWRKLYWRQLLIRGRNGRRHAFRVVATAAILFIAAPAWPQADGSGTPNPENTLNPSVVSNFLARFSRPQVAQAAPRTSQAPRTGQKHTPRMRVSRAKASVAVAEPVSSEPPPHEPPPQPQEQAQSEWPNAQDSVGMAGLVPVEIRTVREMVRTEPEAPLVQEHELSDLDLVARPISRLDGMFDGTDGRANPDDSETRGNRIAAFAENLKAIGSASWLEPILLVLAGAIAAVSAMRVFAT